MTVAYYIASPHWGGGEQYVYDLARHMHSRLGYTCVFLFPAHSDETMVARFSTIGTCPSFPFSHKLFRFSPLAAFCLNRLLRKYKVDILHINSRQSYFIAALAKRMSRDLRVVVTQHLVRKASAGWLWQWAYRQMDVLICPSRLVARTYLASPKVQTAFASVQIIPNSVPITVSSLRNDLPTNEIPTIFYHGRICREKGIIPFIHVLETLKKTPFRLLVAGSVEARIQETWNHILANSPIRERIEYVGFCNDIAPLMQQSHIGIIPSLVPETTPLALLENMAYGLATISSNNGSQPEFMSVSEGFLCSPLTGSGKGEQEWREALQFLLSNPEYCLQMGQNAQKRFQNELRYDQFMDKIQQIYIACISRGQHYA